MTGVGHWLLGAVGAVLLRLWAASWRRKHHGLEQLEAQLTSGERTLLLCWHGDHPVLLALLHRHRVCVLTNRSWRGRMISSFCRHLGLITLELPADSGHSFLFALRQKSVEQPAWATAADGPLGPYHEVKPQLMELAAHFGFVLMPLGAAGRPTWRLKGRWDKMELPLPFSRVALAVGEPLRLPRQLSAAERCRATEEMHQRLERCHQQAEQLIRRHP